jgi:hypothetical protein
MDNVSPAVKSNVEDPDVPKQAGRTRKTRVVPSGHGVGASLGAVVGREVGLSVGGLDGTKVGDVVGPDVGEVVGRPVGTLVVGLSVGASAHSVTVPQGATPFQERETVPTAPSSKERTRRIVPTDMTGDSIRSVTGLVKSRPVQ